MLFSFAALLLPRIGMLLFVCEASSSTQQPESFRTSSVILWPAVCNECFRPKCLLRLSDGQTRFRRCLCAVVACLACRCVERLSYTRRDRIACAHGLLTDVYQKTRLSLSSPLQNSMRYDRELRCFIRKALTTACSDRRDIGVLMQSNFFFLLKVYSNRRESSFKPMLHNTY